VLEQREVERQKWYEKLNQYPEWITESIGTPGIEPRGRLMNGKDPHELSQMDNNLGSPGWFVTNDLGICAWTDGSVMRKGGKRKQNKPSAGWSCFFSLFSPRNGFGRVPSSSD
jgi:hypothetical protein